MFSYWLLITLFQWRNEVLMEYVCLLGYGYGWFYRGPKLISRQTFSSMSKLTSDWEPLLV
jgi:hypothetical protein